MPPYFITTAIPYVNAEPHLGFAMEIIQTDAFARYRRLCGYDVRFLSGTDDNSLTNVIAAEAEGIPTQTLVDRNATSFSALKDHLNLSFDDFIRTSVDPRHLEGANKLWKACDEAGDIYRKPYSGLYCNRCEQFYDESELVDGNCPDHGVPVELVEEENYFFRLSKYSSQLEELIASDTYRIIPQSRKNEILSFIRQGLNDFSISRSKKRARGWGIPVPGDPDQVMYVWFDALSNYINALDYATEGDLYRRFWVENPERVHVIGKGIIRFHAVYWPAMLLSAQVPLPTTLFVHGYISLEGEKMSKSRGNVIDPVFVAETYGIDSLRYYLLRRAHPTEDSNFTRDHFIRVHNSDLADQLGNLLSRVIGMVSRYYDGVVPAAHGDDPAGKALKNYANDLAAKMREAMDNYNPAEAMTAVWDLVAEANRYVVETQPWTIAKTRDEGGAEAKLATVMYNLVETLRIAAWGCAAFMPSTADEIADQLGIDRPRSGLDEALAWGKYPVGNKLSAGGSLFPKLERPPDA